MIQDFSPNIFPRLVRAGLASELWTELSRPKLDSRPTQSALSPLSPEFPTPIFGLRPGLLFLSPIPLPAANCAKFGVLGICCCCTGPPEPSPPPPPPPESCIFSSRATFVTPLDARRAPSSSTASEHRKVHQAIASGIVLACHNECASIIRKRGAKSSSSRLIAAVVNTTREIGVAESFGRGDVRGSFGG